MHADRLLTSTLRTHPRGRALAEIMAEALAAVDPAVSVRRYVRREGSTVVVGDRRYELGSAGRVFVVGGGKAGAPMAQAAYETLGERITAGLVVVKEGHLGASSQPLGPITLCEASHPVPDQRGVDATERMVRLLEGTRAQDLVLVLLSGGASAVMTLPALGVSLADMQGLTGALLRCGASIGEINTLRKHCSRIAGGQLALHAAPAQAAALIVSDVVGSPLDVIASGPTVPDPSTYADAWTIIEQYGLESALPPAVVAHLRAGIAGTRAETPKAGAALWQRVNNQVIASNATAADTAAAAGRARGFHSLVLTTYLEGEAREVGKVAAALAREVALRGLPLERPALIIAGGETTVTLRGDGLGGRNQELALGAASALSGLQDALVIALATDGGDGPTDAAGAVVTGDTLARARAQNLDLAMALQHNDAYHFFAALDDLLRPGPTLTNVNDLLLIAVL